MSKLKTIHLHPNRINRKGNVLLLLIPSIVFALILYLLLSNYKSARQKERVATVQEPSILGEEEVLDNPPQIIPE